MIPAWRDFGQDFKDVDHISTQHRGRKLRGVSSLSNFPIFFPVASSRNPIETKQKLKAN